MIRFLNSLIWPFIDTYKTIITYLIFLKSKNTGLKKKKLIE